ncbi:MAG TPA: cell division protein FtsL [Methylomirabilota bacterium]|nr:cell division protein FtsL [Methylomirabilota bacterium]
MKRPQRLHREHDPRLRRSLTLALAGALLVVLTGLVVVGLRVHQVQLAYQLDALRDERGRLGALVRQLEVEVATLRSPRRIEQRARQLGLAPPAPGQVRLAREFVAGTTGLAAERNRMAMYGLVPSAPADGRTVLQP